VVEEADDDQLSTAEQASAIADRLRRRRPRSTRATAATAAAFDANLSSSEEEAEQSPVRRRPASNKETTRNTGPGIEIKNRNPTFVQYK